MDLINIRFVLIQLLKLLINYCLLFFFKYLFFDLKNIYKKYIFSLILKYIKFTLIYF